jgi:hypothetical protein
MKHQPQEAKIRKMRDTKWIEESKILRSLRSIWDNRQGALGMFVGRYRDDYVLGSY